MSISKSHMFESISVRPAKQNDERCWKNIFVATVKKAADMDERFWFHFLIDGNETLFSVPARKLRETFKKNGIHLMGEGKSLRYTFYIDYKTGSIYTSVSKNDLKPVLTLKQQNN